MGEGVAVGLSATCGDLQEAVAALLDGVNRYPDNAGADLKAVLAEKIGVGTENIVLGNGSSEVLELAARARLGVADEAVIGFPAFFPYQSVVRRAHATPM